MKMMFWRTSMVKKIAISAISFASVLTLQGCALAPDRVDTELDCKLSATEDNIDANCDVTAKATWEFKKGSTNDFDFLSLTVDLSSNSAVLVDSYGSAVLRVKTGDGSVQSKIVDWNLVTGNVVLSDPTSVSSWISQFDGSIYETSIQISDLSYQGVDGPNAVTAEIVYDGEVVAGSTGSWYQSPSNCTGILPDVQLCG